MLCRCMLNTDEQLRTALVPTVTTQHCGGMWVLGMETDAIRWDLIWATGRWTAAWAWDRDTSYPEKLDLFNWGYPGRCNSGVRFKTSSEWPLDWNNWTLWCHKRRENHHDIGQAIKHTSITKTYKSDRIGSKTLIQTLLFNRFSQLCILTLPHRCVVTIWPTNIFKGTEQYNKLDIWYYLHSLIKGLLRHLRCSG